MFVLLIIQTVILVIQTVMLVIPTVMLVLPTVILVPFVEEALSGLSTGPAKQLCVAFVEDETDDFTFRFRVFIMKNHTNHCPSHPHLRKSGPRRNRVTPTKTTSSGSTIILDSHKMTDCHFLLKDRTTQDDQHNF